MVMTDPIADMLTRIRNAIRVHQHSVSMPSSKMKIGIARVLKDEGYISEYAVQAKDESSVSGHAVLELSLKYGPDGEVLIQEIKRISTPGCRRYSGATEIPDVLNGLGISILSTPRGVLSTKECRKENVGGELLCSIY